MPRFSRSIPLLVGALCALLAVPAQAVSSRTYVASYGSDANTTYSCDFAHPCRTFAVAFSQVTTGGEVLAVDGSGYGTITIDRSVSIVANPGVFAGVGVFGGATGVTIATPGVTVTLRGLTINGQGGNVGVSMTSGTKLSIENCVIANFSGSTQTGVYVATAATVRVVNSVIRDNFYGLWLQGGATADISSSKFLGNSSEGIYAVGNTASTTTTASISDTTVTGSAYGIDAYSVNASAIAQIYVIRSTVSNGGLGINAETVAGTAYVGVSESMIAGNSSYGLSQNGAGATLESLGNNTVRKNALGATFGTITTVLTQ